MLTLIYKNVVVSLF